MWYEKPSSHSRLSRAHGAAQQIEMRVRGGHALALLVTLAPAPAVGFAPRPQLAGVWHQSAVPVHAPVVCCDTAQPESSPPPPPPPSLPVREVDSRGFVVPQVGDVVKMPSKWPGEWDVGQVDFVQYIGSRGAYEVDLLPLKDIGGDMYCMPGRKPQSVQMDVGKLGRLAAEYVPERDAYRVDPADLQPLGGRKKEDPDVTAQYMAEYAELKATLLREAALLGAAGSLVSLPLLGGDVALAFGGGAVAGCAYLFLLQTETDGMGSGADVPRAVAALVSGRLALPFVLFTVLASRQLVAGAPPSLGLVPREQFAAAALGFLAYKAPLLVRQVGRAIKELTENSDAQAPLTAGALPTGSLGIAVRLAQQRLAKESDAADEGGAVGSGAGGAAGGVGADPPLVVLCGPSGVGKQTLIARLLDEAPDQYGFSVSCTTRPKREGEIDGVDYSFLSDAEFDAMVEGMPDPHPHPHPHPHPSPSPRPSVGPSPHPGSHPSPHPGPRP